VPPWTRRAFLGGVAASSVILPRVGSALGPGSRLDVAALRIGNATVARPNAWSRLLYEVENSTSVEVEPRTVELEPEDPALFEHPFSVLIGTAPLPDLTARAVEQLVRYLSYGGFLLVDDATANPRGPFVESVRRLTTRMFPTRPLSPLPFDHSVYRAFFLLDRPVGRTTAVESLEGITTGPTTPLILCGNDLSGALDRDETGRDAQAVIPGGESQRREALKLGINLVLYSLTSTYKHDAAHVMELIKEGRLE
jgi:hypothetical protein